MIAARPGPAVRCPARIRRNRLIVSPNRYSNRAEGERRSRRDDAPNFTGILQR